MKNKKPAKGRKPIELTISNNELVNRDAQRREQKAIWDAQAKALKEAAPKVRKMAPPKIVRDGVNLTRNGRPFHLCPLGWYPEKPRTEEEGHAYYTLGDLETHHPLRTRNRRVAREASKLAKSVEPKLKPVAKPLSPEAQAAVDRVRKIAAEREARKAEAQAPLANAIDDAVTKIKAATTPAPTRPANIQSWPNAVCADLPNGEIMHYPNQEMADQQYPGHYLRALNVNVKPVFVPSAKPTFWQRARAPYFSRIDFYGALIGGGIITGIIHAMGWL